MSSLKEQIKSQILKSSQIIEKMGIGWHNCRPTKVWSEAAIVVFMGKMWEKKHFWKKIPVSATSLAKHTTTVEKVILLNEAKYENVKGLRIHIKDTVYVSVKCLFICVFSNGRNYQSDL